jgi:hypothetical protein
LRPEYWQVLATAQIMLMIAYGVLTYHDVCIFKDLIHSLFFLIADIGQMGRAMEINRFP